MAADGWLRTGPAIGDRYHARPLSRPLEVRNCLLYVFGNARHHQLGPAAGSRWIDAWSSGPWFDGWRDAEDLAPDLRGRLTRALVDEGVVEGPDPPVAPAGSWLLSTGWRRRGLSSVTEAPSP